jgi:hypothetical protein
MSTTMEIELTPDIADASPEVQERFRELVAAGTSPRMAEMFALKAAPRVKTDSTYFASHGNLAKQFENAPCGALDNLIKAARAQGYEPGMNDVYDGDLAPAFGHPLGFIPPTGGRNHIRRAAEHLDVDCHGPVEVKRQRHGSTLEEKKGPQLAPDIVEECVERLIKEDPGLRFTKDRNELREKVIAEHGYDDSKLTGELSTNVHTPSV